MSKSSMEEALPFIAGLLGILTIAYMRGTKEEPSKATMRMDMERNRDVVSLATLAELTKSHSIHLRESAVQLLLDRAISDKYFPQILRVCWNEDDPEMKQRGIAAIQQLTKIEENRNILHRWGVLRLLVHVLKTENSESTYRHAVVSLYRLVSNKDKRKTRIVKLGVLDPIVRFLSQMPTHSNDLKYWSLLVIHQLSLTEGLHSALVEKEFIILLAKMTRLSFGNTNMQKLCLHSLVRLISNLDNQEASKQLSTLLDLKMVSLLASCLRNDDLELVSWAVFLMQEFVMKDFARSSFSEVKGILKVLSNLLNTEDGMGIPRIVLRTLKCLAIRNEPFQLDMIKNNIVKKVIACLKSLLHDLVGHAECHEEFLEGEGLKVLTDMATHPNLHISLYISDVFIFLCSGGKNSDHIENSDVLSSVFLFFKSSEPDLQYSGALLLLNLSALSDTMLIKIIDEGALIAIKDTLISTVREDIQAVLAKTLITIVRKKPNTCLLVLEDVLYPLVVRVNELFAEKGNASSLIGSLYTIQIILQSYALFKNFDLSESLSVQIQHLSFCVESVLCKRLVAIDILPNDLQDMLEFIPDMEEADPLLMKNIASRSVASLTAIYQLVPESLDTSKILKLLTALLRVDDELLSQVLMSLATIVSIDPHCRRKLVDYSLSAGLITSIMEKTNESIVKFYCQLLCDRLADFTNSLSFDNDGYLHLDRNSMTPYISLSHDCCEVRNDSWTFESIRATKSVMLFGKYCFEVELKSSGIVQIGWVNPDCSFDPEGGEGVGDDSNSYAYDGYRQRKWHGNIKSNSYGEEWKSGDIVTAMLDLDEGQISFLLNGEDLGIAFTNVPQDIPWYPAVSLAASQGCRFYFGNASGPVKYAPDGYTIFSFVGQDISPPEPKSLRSEYPVEDRQAVLGSEAQLSETSTEQPTTYSPVKIPQMSIESPVDNSSLSPWLSFSIYVDYNDVAKCDWQFGVYDKDLNLVLLRERNMEDTRLLTAHSSEVIFEWNDIEEEYRDVELISTVDAISPSVGDVLTCNVFKYTNLIEFRHNGKLKASTKAVTLDIDNLFPIFRNFRHPRCNLLL